MNPQFGSFTASQLYCPKCKSAQPVREKLLLVLPDAELFDYLCTGCGESLGQRNVPASRSTRPLPQRPHKKQPQQRRLLR
jgi:hypothetical protein